MVHGVDEIGFDILMGNWADVVEFPEATNSMLEIANEYKKAGFEEYNYTFDNNKVAEWKDMLEHLSSENMSGEPTMHFQRISSSFFLAAIDNSLCKDLSKLDSWEYAKKD